MRWYIIEEILEQIGTFTPALIMGLGLVVGIQHAFEPDHIAAISTLVSKSRFTQKTKNPINASVVVWPAPQSTPRIEDFVKESLRNCFLVFCVNLDFETKVLIAAIWSGSNAC